MRALLINPWIYDFAAYDLWLKPLGLLRVAALLRNWGWEVDFVDCLDRFHPLLSRYLDGDPPRSDRFGCGKFPKLEVAKPGPIAKVPRRYFRYGLPLSLVRKELEARPPPDVVFVGSSMTYWYPGPALALQLARETFPEAPSVLGGIYVRLCPKHARADSGATLVHAGGDFFSIADLLRRLNLNHPAREVTGYVRPACDLLRDRSALAIQSSAGCPFSCSYCAAGRLEPEMRQRAPEEVVEEIASCFEGFGTQDFAFYDNALLYRSSSHLDRILSSVIRKRIPCRFHTPNGLHARFLTGQTARLMQESGFVTVRLSLETSQPKRQRATGGKVENCDLARALDHLEQAGFARSDIGVYLLLGLPGQALNEVEADVRFVHGLGAAVHLAEYSPIPGTGDYARLEREGVVENGLDPLWHNNSIFFLRQPGYSLEKVRELRSLVLSLNEAL